VFKAPPGSAAQHEMSNSPSRRTGAPGARLRPLPRIDRAAEVNKAAAAPEHTFTVLPGTAVGRAWDGATGTPPQGEAVSAARGNGAALPNGGGSSIVPFHARSSQEQDLAKALEERSAAFKAEHQRVPFLQDIAQDTEWRTLQNQVDSMKTSLIISSANDRTGSLVKTIEEKFRLCAEEETSTALNDHVGTRLKSSDPKAYYLSREGLRKVVDPEFLRSELCGVDFWEGLCLSVSPVLAC